MKTNLISFWAIVLLFSCLQFACSTPKTKSEKPPTIEDHYDSKPEKCSQDYGVAPGTAMLWADAWLTYLEYALPEKLSASDLADYSQREVSAEQLEQLFNKCSDCNNFRTYFALEERADSFPQSPLVLFTNSKDCSDSLPDSVLVVKNASMKNNYWVDTKTAAQMTQNWKLLINRQRFVNRQWSFDSIYGYNWEVKKMNKIIYDATKTKLQDTSVVFTLTLHTGPIAPGDSSKYSLGALQLDMVYDGKQESAAQLKAGQIIDFSLPCPNFCDQNSVLYNHSLRSKL